MSHADVTSVRQPHPAHGSLEILPGVYDGLSAAAAVVAGFDRLFLSGYSLAASMGYDDDGSISLDDLERTVAAIARVGSAQIIVDMDSGYGDSPEDVAASVSRLVTVGVAGVVIEDQGGDKWCGFDERVVTRSLEDATARVEAAVGAARGQAEVWARTDCVARHGIDEALRRMRGFAAAGADAGVVIAPRNAHEYVILAREAALPLYHVWSQGAPYLPTADDQDRASYAGIVVSSLGAHTALGALSEQYRTLSATVRTAEPPHAIPDAAALRSARAGGAAAPRANRGERWTRPS